MRKNFSKHLIFTILLTAPIFLFAGPVDVKIVKEDEALQEPGACYFLPPKQWMLVDSQFLLPEVKIMVKGKPKLDSHIPPSLNLAMETTDLTIREYISAIAEMNENDPKCKWAEVGTIQTKAGEMVLTQLDLISNWGDVKMLQAIMIKKGCAYVITATAHLSEFAQFSTEFYNSIQSFTINKDLFQLIVDKNKRKELKNLVTNAKEKWKEDLKQNQLANPEIAKETLVKNTFDSPSFQKEVWQPLQEKIVTSYKGMGSKWQDKFFSMLKDDLFSVE